MQSNVQPCVQHINGSGLQLVANDEDGDSTDQEAQQLADDAREDIELSLSNSEDNDSESEESASD